MIDAADATSAADERRVVMGRVRSAVGLAGAVKVESFTEPATNILRYKTWQLRTPTGWRALRVRASRWTGQGLQVQFDGIDERNAADLLRNTEVAVFRHELPPPAKGEYYRDDLLGLTAFNAQGECLGRLDHYVESPAHPFMVLLRQDVQALAETLVPLVKDRVVSVDFAQGTMVLDWKLNWLEQLDDAADA
ncbi:MAG: ribosome maturation factor RimM [Steroidobacteraceae bacterium]